MVEAKKAKWYQVALIELGRYTSLAGIISAGTGLLQGCCPGYKPLDEGIKQKYLHEGPFNYAAELDCKCKELSEKGDVLGDILTRVGWGTAVINGAGKSVSAGALGLVAGEDGENLALYLFDGTYGGRTFNEVVANLNLGLVDDVEENEFGALLKKIEIGASIAAPIVLPLTLGNGDGAAAAAPKPQPVNPSGPF